MTSLARPDLVRWAGGTIARGSRSFGMASKILPRAERENAWLLYAWCRACDDITDGQELGHAVQSAAPDDVDLWEQTRLAIRGDAPVPNSFAALRAVYRDAGLPVAFLEDHLRGFDLDNQGWRPQSTGDLEGYCYHVAGAVGALMAVLMGVSPQDGDTLDRASDLGLAFQLNNIARDLVQDAHEGRCYIPARWLAREGLSQSDLADPAHRPALARFAAQLNDLAMRYDASARLGASRLPTRCRMAILAAANIYGAIGHKVVARGADAWSGRVFTSGAEKLAAAGRALGQSARAAPDPGRVGLFSRAAWYEHGPFGKAELRHL